MIIRVRTRRSESLGTGVAFAVAVVVVLGMAAITPLVLLWPDSHGRPREWFDVLAAVALAVVVAYPALVALVTRVRCPRLLLGSGVSCLPRMFLSFSFLFFPLVIPAVLFLGIAKQCSRHRPACHLLANTAVVVLGLLSIAALLVARDPVSYEYAGGAGYTSDVITAKEAFLSLALSGLGVLAAATTARGSTSDIELLSEDGQRLRAGSAR